MKWRELPLTQDNSDEVCPIEIWKVWCYVILFPDVRRSPHIREDHLGEVGGAESLGEGGANDVAGESID